MQEVLKNKNKGTLRRKKRKKKEFFWRICWPIIIGSSGTCHAFPKDPKVRWMLLPSATPQFSDALNHGRVIDKATKSKALPAYTWHFFRGSRQEPWHLTGQNIAPQPLTWTTWPSHPTSNGLRHRRASRINGSDPTKLNNIPTIYCNEGAESPTRPSLFHST